jgi:hypothetical protein
MKALGEIGFRKAVKFGAMTLLMILYRLLIVPQLRPPFLRMLGAKVGRNVGTTASSATAPSSTSPSVSCWPTR